MVALTSFLLALLLFVSFLFLTKQEARTGRRVFGNMRASFDARTSAWLHIFKHIDAPALIVHGIRDVAQKVAHDIVHLLLATVEALHALLRRTIVRLKERTPLHRSNPRAFIEHMQSVKRERPLEGEKVE